MAIKFGAKTSKMPPRTRSPATKPKARKSEPAAPELERILNKPPGKTKAAKAPEKPKAEKPKEKAKKPDTALTLVPDREMVSIAQLHTFEEFKNVGFMLLRRQVESVFRFAELLLAAKKRLTSEENTKLQAELSVASSTASQYMTIAKSERLHKLKEEGVDLPTTAHVLYLLASMDEPEFKAFNKKHDIDRTLETQEVRRFRSEWKDKDAISQLPKTTLQATQEATSQAAAEATAPVGDGDPEAFFQETEETGTAEGSPAIPATGESNVLAIFRELGDGILSLTREDIAAAVLDAQTAGEMLGFATRLVEHAEAIRQTLSDREFDLQEEAAA